MSDMTHISKEPEAARSAGAPPAATVDRSEPPPPSWLPSDTPPTPLGFDDFALAPEERTGPDGPGLTDAGRIRLWVAKEAALKAAGVGLAVDPSSVRLVPAGTGGRAGTLLAECAGNPTVHGLLVTPVPAPHGYAAAIAAPGGLTAQAVSLAEIFATKR